MNDQEKFCFVDVLEDSSNGTLFSRTPSITPAGLEEVFGPAALPQSFSPLSSLIAFSSPPASPSASPSCHGSSSSNGDSAFDYDAEVALSLEREDWDVRAHSSATLAIAQSIEDSVSSTQLEAKQEFVGGGSISNLASDHIFFGHPRSSPSPTIMASKATDLLTFGNISPISLTFQEEFNSQCFGSFATDFLFAPIHIVRNKPILPLISEFFFSNWYCGRNHCIFNFVFPIFGFWGLNNIRNLFFFYLVNPS